ncbi:hypothetical protein NFI96_016358 [Prochilodus magdalenae]|nr:hypothetical protein NFI96_016358 [Prochilodus magdalenae]
MKSLGSSCSSSSRAAGEPPQASRERRAGRGALCAAWPRGAPRDLTFCMAALLLFCLGSLFIQLNGGPPKVLLELRNYLGRSLSVFTVLAGLEEC